MAKEKSPYFLASHTHANLILFIASQYINPSSTNSHFHPHKDDPLAKAIKFFATWSIYKTYPIPWWTKNTSLL